MSATSKSETPESELTPELIERVMRLSPESLGRLVGLALERLDVPPDDPEEVKKAWKEEIARRIEAYRRGEVVALDAAGSGERIRARLRERFGDGR
jgi:hypothetical protein